MRSFSTKQVVTAVLIALVFIGVLTFAVVRMKTPATVPVPQEKPQDLGYAHTMIGKSVQGRTIDAYTYGTGTTHLLFVGGIHGGYEWNSVLLAYQFMDYLKANPTILPKNLTITIVPSANPDGVFKVINKEGRFAAVDVPPGGKEVQAPGRFNAHTVDLNRNFDCKWKSESTWQSKIVSAGTSAFSEPETSALRDFVLKEKPDAVVFWHSQSNAVYASECEKGILPKTLEVMNAYAKATGYPAVSSFDAYPITGDAEGWLASINIPAITVELQTHETVEWERNLAGIKALITLYSK
jgi:predicted deacylase